MTPTGSSRENGHIAAHRTQTHRDGIEKSLPLLPFRGRVQDMNIPVIAGRVGALGLVHQALDVCVFLSSL
jgi:hypothetical protein